MFTNQISLREEAADDVLEEYIRKQKLETPRKIVEKVVEEVEEIADKVGM